MRTVQLINNPKRTGARTLCNMRLIPSIPQKGIAHVVQGRIQHHGHRLNDDNQGWIQFVESQEDEHHTATKSSSKVSGVCIFQNRCYCLTARLMRLGHQLLEEAVFQTASKNNLNVQERAQSQAQSLSRVRSARSLSPPRSPAQSHAQSRAQSRQERHSAM